MHHMDCEIAYNKKVFNFTLDYSTKKAAITNCQEMFEFFYNEVDTLIDGPEVPEMPKFLLLLFCNLFRCKGSKFIAEEVAICPYSGMKEDEYTMASLVIFLLYMYDCIRFNHIKLKQEDNQVIVLDDGAYFVKNFIHDVCKEDRIRTYMNGYSGFNGKVATLPRNIFDYVRSTEDGNSPIIYSKVFGLGTYHKYLKCMLLESSYNPFCTLCGRFCFDLQLARTKVREDLPHLFANAPFKLDINELDWGDDFDLIASL